MSWHCPGGKHFGLQYSFNMYLLGTVGEAPDSQTQFTQEVFLFPDRMPELPLPLLREPLRESLWAQGFTIKGMLPHFLKEFSVRLNSFLKSRLRIRNRKKVIQQN